MHGTSATGWLFVVGFFAFCVFGLFFGNHETAPPRRALLRRDAVTPAVRIAVWRRDGGRCVQCGAYGPGAQLEYDHIIPWSKGGASSEANIQLLCLSCNRRKGARIC